MSSGNSGSAPPSSKRRNVKPSPPASVMGAPPSPPSEQIRRVGTAPGTGTTGSSIPPAQQFNSEAQRRVYGYNSEAAPAAAAPASALAPPSAAALSEASSFIIFPNANNIPAPSAEQRVLPLNSESSIASNSGSGTEGPATDEEYFPFAQEFNQAEEGDFDFFRDDENVPTQAEIKAFQRVLNGEVEEGNEKLLSQILSEPVEGEAAAASAASAAPNNTAVERRLAAEAAAAAAAAEATQLSQFLKITRGQVRLEPLPPTQQAIQIHGTSATALHPETTICSLCGFRLRARGRLTQHLGGGSYEHTLPVNLVVFFFSYCSDRSYV